MSARIEEMIDDILKREGSAYTDHPKDRGGPTRYGVTQATLAEYRGRAVTPLEVAALNEAEARAIYRKRYIADPGFAQIVSDDLRTVLVDFGVNSGPSAAIRALQRCLGVAVDGVLGPKTAEAANARIGKSLAVAVCAARIRFLGRLITDDPAQATFAAGWMNRVAALLEALS